MGIGQPAGEGGFNIGRVVAALAGLGRRPRRHRQPLLLVQPADHPHGASTPSRPARATASSPPVSRPSAATPTAPATWPPTPSSRSPGERTKLRAQGGQGTWTPPEGLPDMYIAMGQTAENVVEVEGISREDMDRFGVRSQNLACDHVDNGFFEREITPLTLPDGTVGQQGRRPPPRHQLRGRQPAEAGVPPRRHRHRRQRLPAERRRRRRAGDERHQGQAARPHPAGPHRGVGRVRPEPRDHGPRPDRGHPPDARPRRHDHRPDRPGRDQRGVRLPGHRLGPATSASTSTSR